MKKKEEEEEEEGGRRRRRWKVERLSFTTRCISWSVNESFASVPCSSFFRYATHPVLCFDNG